ncbi:MAG: hypothetical protein GWO24_06035, partial [Akkermansiaceae bacterium]|nr:hypothetical protein [Akkermansiaceae bacterium]
AGIATGNISQTVEAFVGRNARVTGTNRVFIAAEDESTVRTVALGGAGGGGFAAGVGFARHDIGNEVLAFVDARGSDTT